MRDECIRENGEKERQGLGNEWEYKRVNMGGRAGGREINEW